MSSKKRCQIAQFLVFCGLTQTVSPHELEEVEEDASGSELDNMEYKEEEEECEAKMRHTKVNHD
jgi:hypothetical protein